MLSDLSHVFPDRQLAVTLGLAASWLLAPLIAQVVLSYPSGRLSSRVDRVYIATAWVLAAAYGLVFMLFYSPRSPFDVHVWWCATCALPYTHVAWANLIAFDRNFSRVVLVLALVGVGLLIRKIVRGSPGGRRVLLPLTFSACFIVGQFAVQIALYGHSVNSWTHPTWFWISTAAPLSIPVALALGLLWGDGGRGPVAGLVVELERTPPGSVRDALGAGTRRPLARARALAARAWDVRRCRRAGSRASRTGKGSCCDDDRCRGGPGRRARARSGAAGAAGPSRRRRSGGSPGTRKRAAAGGAARAAR